MPVSKRVRLSSKGQMVIPQGMRQSLGLHTGDELVLHVLSDRILLAEVVEPSPLQPLLTRLEAEARRGKLTPGRVEQALAESRQSPSLSPKTE